MATKGKKIIVLPHGQLKKVCEELGVSDNTMRLYLREKYGKFDMAYENQERARRFVIQRYGAACVVNG